MREKTGKRKRARENRGKDRLKAREIKEKDREKQKEREREKWKERAGGGGGKEKDNTNRLGERDSKLEIRESETGGTERGRETLTERQVELLRKAQHPKS